jgi:hypothetical protein
VVCPQSTKGRLRPVVGPTRSNIKSTIFPLLAVGADSLVRYYVVKLIQNGRIDDPQLPAEDQQR